MEPLSTFTQMPTPRMAAPASWGEGRGEREGERERERGGGEKFEPFPHPYHMRPEPTSGPCALNRLVSGTAVGLLIRCACPRMRRPHPPGHERPDEHGEGKSHLLQREVFPLVPPGSPSRRRFTAAIYRASPAASGRLLVRVALELVELHAVQLLEALLAELAGEVVVGLRRVLLHVPVQRRPLATLVATDLTSDE
ncbi:hypothetical protein EYF80_049119 [Liparis tanakae]|uniref:Uncharacterized protein n=1 Tax=Liparis tanakae TaxID=230148 RepID=A0A4Z2FHU0_9TELE|nr:hypothetical protein EYF80_049119 [Liparis tanakae]